MKKVLFYSFCGCFMTSAAVAMSLFMDVGTESQCGGFCLVNPGNGECCPSDSVMAKLNVSADNASKVLDGLYISDGGKNGIKLFDNTGAPRSLSTDELNSIKAAAESAAAEGETIHLDKKQYNSGTIFTWLDQETGEVVESQTPPRSGTCDLLEIVLVPCTGYPSWYAGQTFWNPTYQNRKVCNYTNTQSIFYNVNNGYFSSRDLTESNRYKDETHPNAAKTLTPPTLAGHTFRGWFPTWWNTAITDTSSYINNLSPYRTIGHAYYIPWKSSDLSQGLYLARPDWTYSSGNCKLYLFAGWAENCVNPEHCEIKISGKAEEGIRSLDDKINISGRWLPGAVEYKWKGDTCQNPQGYTDITKTYTYPGTSNTIDFTHHLGNKNLGCAAVPRIKLTYHGNGVTTYDYCDIDGTDTVTIKNSISNQTISAVAYTSGGAAVFEAGDTVNCKVGTGGFTNYTPNGNDYDVDLYPAQPVMTEIQLKYSVSLPNSGGNLSTLCTVTETCTVGSGTTLQSEITCSGETVQVSKWTNTGGTEFTAGSAQQCNENNFPVTYSNGVYTSTLTGTIATPTVIHVTLETKGGTMDGESVSITKGEELLPNIEPTREDGAVFMGWYAKGASENTASKQTIIGDNVADGATYVARYGCETGKSMNGYGTCVDESGNTDYIDKSGGSVQPGQMNCWRPTGPNGSYENYCHWKLNVTLHDSTSSQNSVTNSGITSGNDGLKLLCEGAGCKVASGSPKNCCTPDSGNAISDPTCNTGAGLLCASISTPIANGWKFRGYFKDDVGNIITTAGDTTFSAFSNFFPKNLNNRTISVTGHAVVVMENTPVEIVCNGTWQSRPDGTRYCVGSQTTAPLDIDLYGGWAQECTVATSTNPSECTLQIGNNWNISNGLRKGNVRYVTSCTNGFTLDPNTNNTYNPQCSKDEGSYTVNYTFVDQYGETVSGCNVSIDTCGANSTYYMPGQTACGSNYTIKYLRTDDGLYTPGHPAVCSHNLFGQTGMVTGYACRNSCQMGDNIPGGTCVMASLAGGTVNGGDEITDNIWNNCYIVQCNAGYKLNPVTAECIYQGS